MLDDSGKTSSIREELDRRIDAESQTILVETTNVKCGQKPVKTPPKKHGAFVLFKRQDRAFAKLRRATYGLLIMPTASGKTIVTIALALDDLVETGRKQIICYPQNDIATNFGGSGGNGPVSINVPGRGPLTWAPVQGTENKVRLIVDFLSGAPAKDPHQCTLICTQQALVLALAEIKRQGVNTDPLHQTSVYIDECHHVSWDDSEQNQLQNRLGELVKDSIESGSGRLILVTATFTRTDGQIIPAEHREKFTTHQLYYDEFLKEMEHLREIKWYFVLGPREAAFEQIIRKDPAQETVAWTAANEYGPSKHNLIRRLRRKLPPEVDGRTLDFTDSKERPRTRQIFNAIKSKAHEWPLLVWHHNTWIEGNDWPPACRGVLLAPRKNVRNMAQIAGRFLRDFKGKSTVEIYTIIPRSRGHEPATLEQLEDYLSAVFATMVAGWMFSVSSLQGKTRAEKAANKKADQIVHQPETRELLMGMARAIAKHEGDPEKSRAAIDSFLRNCADERPEWADLADSKVRKSLVENIQERTYGPASAAREVHTKLPSFKGARDLLDIHLIKENPLSKFIQLLSFTCGHEGWKAMREALSEAQIGLLTRAAIKDAIVNWRSVHGEAPNSCTVNPVCIDGQWCKWPSLDSHCRSRLGCSVPLLVAELYGTRFDFEVIDVKIACAQSLADEGKFPPMAGRLDVKGQSYACSAVDQQLRHHMHSSLSIIRAELTGYRRGQCPTDEEIVEEARHFERVHGKRPGVHSGAFGQGPITWRNVDRSLENKGSNLKILLDKHLGALLFNYREWFRYMTTARCTEYDITTYFGYVDACRKGLLDARCPRDPSCVYKRTGDWKGWPFEGRKRGEASHRSKLTDAEVSKIKQRLRMGVSGAELGRAFQVSQSTIHLIKTGRNWAHVK